MYTVEVTKAAAGALQRIPDPHRRRLLVAIERLASDPGPAGCRKLTGTDQDWRIRVGAWRVLYRVQDAQVLVTVIRVAHRKQAYRP